MTSALVPTTAAELAEMVRATPKLLPAGGRTKGRLTAIDVPRLSTLKLSGLVEYDPGEFTFTAMAGTAVREIESALAERGQYLPFDPPLAEAGATLGGTVAAGLNGPGRFRLGGVRDFILGVRFVDAEGRQLRAGGKVVKNAAGFDLPKFFVGSCGRFGVLTEMTFKVLPKPASSLTVSCEVETMEDAARKLIEAGNSRWEPEAVDLVPGGKAVCIRLAGPAAGLDALAADILARWPGRKLPEMEANALRRQLREFEWAHRDGWLIKVPFTPAGLPKFAAALNAEWDTRFHVSSGGNVAFVSFPDAGAAQKVDSLLAGLGWPAMTLRGGGPLWLGRRQDWAIGEAVKRALDPVNRFPGLRD